MSRAKTAQPSEVAARAEHVEASYFRRFLTDVPSDDRDRLGIRSAMRREGVLTAMRDDPSGYWTKALGFWDSTPLSRDDLRAVVRFFEESGAARGRLAIAPWVLPKEWGVWVEEEGLGRAGGWSKFVCDVEDLKPGRTDLPIRELVDGDLTQWADLVRTQLLPAPDLSPMLAAAIAAPDVHVFGAFDGTELVGAAAVHLVGRSASLNTAATRPEHRGRGVQSALIAARANAARAAGCDLLVAETAAADDGTANGSQRNLERAGFRRLYDRPNWTWTAAA